MTQTTASSTTAFVLVRPRPDAAQAVVNVLTPLVAPSRQEPGCLGYDLYREQDGAVVLVESWATADDFATHCRQPAVRSAFDEQIPQLVERPVEAHVTACLTAGA